MVNIKSAKAQMVKCNISIIHINFNILAASVSNCLFQQCISNLRLFVLDREKKQKINDIKNNIKEAIEVRFQVLLLHFLQEIIGLTVF